MTERSDTRPTLPGRQDAERQARLAREAAALRENLQRRKQQARLRRDAPLPVADAERADDGAPPRSGNCPSG